MLPSASLAGVPREGVRIFGMYEEAVDNTEAGDLLKVDLSNGKIKNLTNGMVFTAKPYPDFMSELIAAGGLIEYTKKRLASRRR